MKSKVIKKIIQHQMNQKPFPGRTQHQGTLKAFPSKIQHQKNWKMSPFRPIIQKHSYRYIDFIKSFLKEPETYIKDGTGTYFTIGVISMICFLVVRMIIHR